jgi:hypothetical protein
MASSRLHSVLRTAGKQAARSVVNNPTGVAPLSSSSASDPLPVDESEEDHNYNTSHSRKSEAAQYGSTRIGMVELPSQLETTVANLIESKPVRSLKSLLGLS